MLHALVKHLDPKELFLKTVTRFCQLPRPKTFVLDLETLILLQESLILTCFQHLFSNYSYTFWLNIWAPQRSVFKDCYTLLPITVSQNFRSRFRNIGFNTRIIIDLNLLPKPCFLMTVTRFGWILGPPKNCFWKPVTRFC